MPSMAAILEVAITANTVNAEQGFTRVSAQLDQLVQRSGGADASFTKLTGSFALGTVAANAFMGAVGGIGNAMGQAAGGILSLASRLEQAKIGFTTMLGSAQAATEFISTLQAKAESTAFNFPGLQQVAQSFLAMNMTGQQALVTIDDVSNALSAAGHGGDTDRLQRVGQSLAEISAQGKLSGEQIRELSRNGIAVLPLLSEAFGVTAAEVRKMSEASEISADKFFAAFHSEVAMHYGDIQAQQAKTWAVAASNVQDILGRLSTQTFKELTDALTAAALGFNDFLHSERVVAWAGQVKVAIHDVITALAPLGALFQAAMGTSGQAPAAAALPTVNVGRGAPDEGTRANWIVPPAAVKSVDDYKAEVADANLKIHETTAEINRLGAEKLTLKYEIEDKTAEFKAKLQGLRDEQETWNVKIAATKAHYEAILAPLNRAQSQLSRLGEDTKADFATILDPLKTSLETTNRQIQDAKAGYEAFSRPIQAQIDGIEKANSALQKQLSTQNQIADLALRQRVLDASGDPNARGDIAAKLLLNQYARDDLANQRTLAEAANQKGLSEKAAADFKNQQSSLDAEHARLEIQARGLIDRDAMAQIEHDRTINDLTKERGAILQGNNNIAAQAQVDPLQAELDAAKKNLASVLDPLELMQASLTRAIRDTTDAETAAMAPIIAAQQELARTIQDVTQSQKDALKPMEDQQKIIGDRIKETEAAQRRVLGPLQAQEDSLQRHIDKQEAIKKHWEEVKTAGSDAMKQIKTDAEEAATAAAQAPKAAAMIADRGPVLDPRDQGIAPPSFASPLISTEVIANINAFATSLGGLGAQMKAMNDSGDMTRISNAVLILGTVIVGALIVKGLAGIGLAAAGVIGWAASVAEGFGMVAGAAGVLGAAFGGGALLMTGILGLIAIGVALQVGWNTNFMGIRTTVETGLKAIENALGPFGAAFFDVFGIMLLAWSGNWTLAFDAVKGHWDTWSAGFKVLFDGWKADWDKAWAETWTLWGIDWAKLQDAPKLAWDTLTAWLAPAVDSIVKFFDPLAAALSSIADALSKIPSQLPGWMTGQLLGGMGTGGGGAGINLPGGHGGGNVDLTAGNPGQNQIGLSGQDAATACGPYAALLFYNSIGRFPTAEEAIDLARQAGWTQGAGMGGMWNFVKMLGLEGISGNIDTTPTAEESRAALKAGSPLAFSTPNHYFAATGIDASDSYHVGGTGTALRGGSEWMTLEEMTTLGGGMQGVITISQQMGDAVELAKNRAAAGLAGIMAPIRATGVGLAQSLAQGLSSGSPVVADAVERIATAAIANGLDPRVLLAIAQQESGLNPNAVGDSGHSVGLFQLSDTGQGAGMSVAARQDAQTNIDKFLNPENIALIKQLMAGGMSGRALAVEAGRLTERPRGGEDPNSAAAQSYGVQYDAITKLTAGQNAAIAGTQRLGAVQVQATDWAKVFADQQAHLALIMQQQVPAGMLSASDSMKLFGSVLGPIERQIAGGEIGVGTLEFKLLDLARATGLNTAAWAKFSSGAEDSTAAMGELIDSTAALGPDFAAVAAYQHTAGADTVEASLRWFQAAKNYQAAKVALADAPAVPPVPVVGAPGSAGAHPPVASPAALNTAPITAVGTAWDVTKAKADAAGLSVRAYTDVVNALDPKNIAAQTDAWDAGTEAVNKFSDAAHQIGDYLDSHDFHFHATFDPVPSDYQGHSPSPLENSLRGIVQAGELLNRTHIRPALHPLEMPSPSASVRATAERGGGQTTVGGGDVHVHLQSFLGTKEELTEAVHQGLLAKKRTNGRLGLGDQDR